MSYKGTAAPRSRSTGESEFSKLLSPLSRLIRRYWIQEFETWHLVTTGSKIDYAPNDIIPVWDGGETAFGRQQEPVWDSLAEYCLAHHLQPRIWIRTLFITWRRRHRPKPPDLRSATLLTHYRERLPRIMQDGVTRCRWEQEAVELRLFELSRSVMRYTPQQAVQVLLQEGRTPMSPVTRYIVASEAGMSELVREWEDKALTYYFLHREMLDAGWGSRIPERLRRAADQLDSEYQVERVNHCTSGEGTE